MAGNKQISVPVCKVKYQPFRRVVAGETGGGSGGGGGGADGSMGADGSSVRGSQQQGNGPRKGDQQHQQQQQQEQQQRQQQRGQQQHHNQHSNQSGGREKMYACHLHHSKRKALIECSGPREGWEAFSQWHGDDDDGAIDRPTEAPTSPRPCSRDGFNRGGGGTEMGATAAETAHAPRLHNDGEDQRDGGGVSHGGADRGPAGRQTASILAPAHDPDIAGEDGHGGSPLSPQRHIGNDGGGVLGDAVVLDLGRGIPQQDSDVAEVATCWGHKRRRVAGNER